MDHIPDYKCMLSFKAPHFCEAQGHEVYANEWADTGHEPMKVFCMQHDDANAVPQLKASACVSNSSGSAISAK